MLLARRPLLPMTLALLGAFACILPASAQDPKPEANGDWSANWGYVQGTVSKSQRNKDPEICAGYRWVVIASNINAYQQPDAKSRVLTHFVKGTKIITPPISGGSSENQRNTKDAAGNYYMPVLLKNGKTCYVRANSRFIMPLKK